MRNHFFQLFLTGLLSVAGLFAEESTSITKDGLVVIGGQEIQYSVTAAKLRLTNAKGEDRASIFHFSYLRKNVGDVDKRPVLFAFNGGPGSSSVWLHLGGLGPKIVPNSKDGTADLLPNLRLKDNPCSILDKVDLVFVDPVSTGYSEIGKDAKTEDFHGVYKDIEACSDFIRQWVGEHGRWSSPKYILGESYGGLRAAGMANHLQTRYGMGLNGVILLSGVLDYATTRNDEGHDLGYLCALPSLVATAHHHGVVKGNRDDLLEKCDEFMDVYAGALMRGDALDDSDRQEIACRISDLIGLPKQTVLDADLRVSPLLFRKELLKVQGKLLGRFDGRVAWSDVNPPGSLPEFDPSASRIKGAFTSCMMGYLTEEIGWKTQRVYEVSANVQPWDWVFTNRYVNMGPRLASAMKHNPRLKVLVQCGYSDLATPFSGMVHSINHLDIPKSLRGNIEFAWYDAGHMFYLNEPDMKKCRTDLVKFFEMDSN